MPLDIKVKTFGMAREPEQLNEISEIVRSSEPGDILLFPEYVAYTLEGSEKACAALSRLADDRGLSIITTLNLPGVDLPFSDPKKNHNTLYIFSRYGGIYSPQAKITPQSFEMRHLDKAFPKMDVAPYSYLNRITLRVNGENYSAFFLICSDVYVLPMFSFEELASDVIFCPANFGNGAEQAAGGVIEYAVQSGLFRQGFVCNTYQNARQGLLPLTVGLQKTYEAKATGAPFDPENLRQRVRRASVVYPEEGYDNFKSMLALTRQGTFTIPRSRSLENGLQVHLGRYPTVVDL